jgi:hypothetical protein
MKLMNKKDTVVVKYLLGVDRWHTDKVQKFMAALS